MCSAGTCKCPVHSTPTLDDSLVMRLAHLLACYEMDEPRAGYRFDPQDSCSYDGPTAGELKEWLAMDHHGDCVKQATACRRCMAEHIWHKAEWIATSLVRRGNGVTMSDNWKHRSDTMKCKSCMWFVEKVVDATWPVTPEEPEHCKTFHLGRCRRRAPTLNGWPAVFVNDWCGDHKLDENKPDSVRRTRSVSGRPQKRGVPPMHDSQITQAQTDPLDAIVRRYFGREVLVWCVDLDWNPYPWRFAVRDTNGVVHNYGGIPNKCPTYHSALMRGWYRAKWMHGGTYQDRYHPIH